MKVVVGRVGKPHGLEGAFVVEQASEEPERFVVGARFVVEGDEAEIVEAKRAGGRPVIRLDRSVRRGAALEVDRESLPDLGPDNYYVADLVGCTVERAIAEIEKTEWPARDEFIAENLRAAPSRREATEHFESLM